jgi:MFS family permease
MMATQPSIRFGPAALQPGVTMRHAWGLMYASFVTIGFATGIAVLTPYVLTTNLGIAQSAQGTALGTLAIAQELALLIGFALFGAMADKVGRRVVYSLGMVLLAVGYGAYAFGSTMTELVLFRVIYAFGIGAATGMFATIISDYAVVNDRGKLTALCGFLNGLGVVVVAIFLGKLPGFFAARGADPVSAGQDALGGRGRVCSGAVAHAQARRARCGRYQEADLAAAGRGNRRGAGKSSDRGLLRRGLRRAR